VRNKQSYVRGPNDLCFFDIEVKMLTASNLIASIFGGIQSIIIGSCTYFRNALKTPVHEFFEKIFFHRAIGNNGHIRSALSRDQRGR